MRHEATEGRSVAAPVQGGRAAGHGGAQRGCARTGGQGSRARRGAARLRPYRGGRAAGTEGRSTAAPVQGAARGKRREGRGVVYERRR
jgi:hypothetical protein